MTLRLVLAVLLVLVTGYGLSEAMPLIRGPQIVLETPSAHELTEDGFVRISGQATRTDTLILNGAPLLIDENDRFSRTLLLPPGGAILSLAASDRFGRTKMITRSVLIP